MKNTLIKNLLLATVFAHSTAFAMTIADKGNYTFDKMSDDVFVLHGPVELPNVGNDGFMNNPGIIMVKDGVVLVDPGSSYYIGKKLVKEIKTITTNPVVAVFNTHVHGDHWLGNHAIQEAYPNVKIYGHNTMIDRAIEEEGEKWVGLLNKYTEGLTSETKVVVPTNSVKHLDTIDVNGSLFRIHAPTEKAHTNTDIMIEHVDSKTMFLGDNLFNGRLGRFDNTSDMHLNLEALHYSNNLKLDTYVPGHGPSGDSEKALKPFLSYLEVIKAHSYAGYEEDLADYEIKPAVLLEISAYENWSDFSMVGLHINKFLSEVEDRDL